MAENGYHSREKKESRLSRSEKKDIKKQKKITKNAVDKFIKDLKKTGNRISNDDIYNIKNKYSKYENGEITELFLFVSELKSLPATIGELTTLKKLTIYKTQLTSLPETIGNLTSLKELTIMYNRLSSLPATIGDLKNLKELNLSNNQLTSLPASIGNLSSLQKLNLSWNKLESLPATIGNLTNLKNLSLEHNELTTLPTTIGNLSSLQILELHRNKFEVVPASLDTLRACGCDISGCDIYSIKRQKKNEEFRKKEAKLPEELQDALSSEEFGDFYEEICTKYDILSYLYELNEIVGNVFLGDLSPKDFKESIKDALNLSEEDSITFTQEFNHKIFYLVRSGLRKIYNSNEIGHRIKAEWKKFEKEEEGIN